MKFFISFFGAVLCFRAGYVEGDELHPLVFAARDGRYELEAFPVISSILCCLSESMDKAAYSIEVNSISNEISKVITKSSDMDENFLCKKKYVPSIRFSSTDTKEMTNVESGDLIIYQSGYEVCDLHNLLHGTGLPALKDENCEFFPLLDILYDKVEASVKQVRYRLTVSKEEEEKDEPCENLDLGGVFFDANMKLAYSLGKFKPQLLAPVLHFRDESLKLPICSYLNTAPVYVSNSVDEAWKEVNSFVRKIAMVTKVELNIITGAFRKNEYDSKSPADPVGEVYLLHQVPVPDALYVVFFHRVALSEDANNGYDHFGMILTVMNTPDGNPDMPKDYICVEIECGAYYHRFGKYYRNSLIRCCAFNDPNLWLLRIKIEEQGPQWNRMLTLSSFHPDTKSRLQTLNVVDDMDRVMEGYRKREDLQV